MVLPIPKTSICILTVTIIYPDIRIRHIGLINVDANIPQNRGIDICVVRLPFLGGSKANFEILLILGCFGAVFS